MRYIIVHLSAGYCGTDAVEFLTYEDSVTDAEIQEDVDELVYNHAEAYEYLETGWGEDFESDEDRDYYYSQAADYSAWEEVDEQTWLEQKDIYE